MRALNLCTLPLVSLLLSPGAVHALPGFSGKQPSILAPDDLSAQISDPSALREPPPHECPRTVTLSTCQRQGLETLCTAAELQQLDANCQELILAEQERVTADWPQADILSIDTGSTVSGAVEEAPVSALTFDGFFASYARQSMLARATCEELDAERERERNHTRWRSNCVTTSCEEYIFDKYFDYELFEDLIAPIGGDDRAIFNAIYGADGIARKRIEDVEGYQSYNLDFGQRRNGRNAYLGFDIEAEPIDWINVARRNGFAGLPDGSSLGENLPGCPFDALQNQFDCEPDAGLESALFANMLNERLQPYDPARLSAMTPGRVLWPDASVDWWDFHEQASQQLAGYSDARLQWLGERQSEFYLLRDQRDEIARSINEALTWIQVFEDATGMSEADRQVSIAAAQAWLQSDVRALKEQDQSIQAALDFAEAQGCLDVENDFTPCDWSPAWPARSLQQQFLTEREEDYQRCMRITGNNFRRLITPTGSDAPHWIEAAQEGFLEMGEDICEDPQGGRIDGCVITDNYVRNWGMVENYMTTVEAWLAKLPIKEDPETGEPILAESYSDSAKEGGSLFGVDMGYSFGWSIDGLVEDGCRIGVDSHANAHLDATAFGYNTADHNGLFAADYAIEVSSQDHAAKRSLIVFGQELYDPTRVTPTNSVDEPPRQIFNFVRSEDTTLSYDKTQTIMLGWVPVTFSAGLAGTLGIKEELISSRRSCQGSEADLSAQHDFVVSPFANARGYAAGVAGVHGVSIGVRADLTIFDLGLPFRSTSSLQLSQNKLSIDASLDFEMTLLAGGVNLIAELAWKTYRKSLFSWSGISQSNNFLRSAYAIPTDILLRLLDEDRENQGLDTGRLMMNLAGQCLSPVTLDAPTLYLSLDNDRVNQVDQTVADEIGGALFDIVGAVDLGMPGVFAEAFAMSHLSGQLVPQVSLPSSSDYTHAFWMKPEGGNGTVFQRGTSPEELRVSVNADQRDIEIRTSCAGEPKGYHLRLPWAEAPISPGRNGFVHFAVVKEGDMLNFYGNGSSLGRLRCTAQNISDAGLRYGLQIHATGSALPYGGALDEIVFYDGVALDPGQVMELYQRGAEGRPAFGDGAHRPMGVTELSAEPGDGWVSLSWFNPLDLGTDTGASEVMLRFDTSRAPLDLEQGQELYRGQDSAAYHLEAHNGTTYHYTAFALRSDGTFLRGPSVSATPTENPVSQVTNATAQAGELQVLLNWRNPGSPNFERVVINRSRPNPGPRRLADIQVYRGTAQSYADRDLQAGTEYTYSIYSEDRRGNLSTPVLLVATPNDGMVPDTQPPGPVDMLQGEADEGAIVLSWSNPSDQDFDHVEISRYSVSTLNYRQVYLGADSRFSDSEVRHGQSYRYSLVAVDAAGNVSALRRVEVRAADLVLRPVSRLTARYLEGQLRLTWSKPTNPELAGVRIRRSTAGFPSTANSGRLIYEGLDSSFYDDANLMEGVTYYYSAFAYAADSLFAAPAFSSVVFEATNSTPPPPVQNLVAQAGFNSAVLSWDLPHVGDLLRVEVWGGREPFSDIGGQTQIFVGLDTHLIHDTLEPTYYGVFAVDTSDNRSKGAFAYVEPVLPPLRVEANAGPDQSVRGGDVVRLSAEESIALDGQPLTSFAWQQISGPSVYPDPANGAVSHFVAPGEGGLFFFEVEVSDGLRADIDQVSVEVSPFKAPRLDSEHNPFSDTFWPMESLRGWAADNNDHIIRKYEIVQDADNSTWSQRVFDRLTREPISADLYWNDLSNSSHFEVQGDRLFSTKGAFEVKVLDIADLQAVQTLATLETSNSVYQFAMSPKVGVLDELTDRTRIQVFAFDAASGLSHAADIARFDATLGTLQFWALSPVHDVLYITRSSIDSGYSLLVCDLSTATSPSCQVLESHSEPNPQDSNLLVTEDYLLLERSSELALYELSDPLNPSQIATFPDKPRQATNSVRQIGDKLVWLGEDGMVELWDLSTPSSPQRAPLTMPVVSEMSYDNVHGRQPPLLLPQNDPRELWVPLKNYTSYIPSRQQGGVRVFDLDTLGMAPPYPSVAAERRPFNYKVDGTRAVVLSEAGLSVVDLDSMSEQGFVARDDLFYGYVHSSSQTYTVLFSPVDTEADLAFAIGGSQLGSLLVFDITDPQQPSLVAEHDLGTTKCTQLLADGSQLWLNCLNGKSVYDLSDPTSPVLLDYVDPLELWPHSGLVGLYQYDLGRNVIVDEARGVVIRPLDNFNLIEAQFSLDVTPNGPRQVHMLDQHHLLVANGMHGLQKIDLDPLQLDVHHREAVVDEVLVYQLTLMEPDADMSRISQLSCEVSGGACVIDNVSTLTGMQTATLSWTLPSTAGDHELLIMAGHEQYYVSLRERVQVLPE